MFLFDPSGGTRDLRGTEKGPCRNSEYRVSPSFPSDQSLLTSVVGEGKLFETTFTYVETTE